LLLLCVIAALFIVGIASGTELRHAVQTSPLWLPVILGARRSPSAGSFALPMFVFWLGIMVLIWLYLLGWAHIVSGQFTATEIAMTIVVGLACIPGVITAARGWRLATGAPLFVVGLALQVAAFWVSLQPAIATR
jgi:hypothetical protein